jgi:hypothetical protein
MRTRGRAIPRRYATCVAIPQMPHTLHLLALGGTIVRSSVFVGTVLSVMLATACDKAPDAENQVRSAQAEANDKADAALKEADEKVKTAQGAADEKIADARTDFMKKREDYRHATTTSLIDLDHQVVDLTVKANGS